MTGSAPLGGPPAPDEDDAAGPANAQSAVYAALKRRITAGALPPGAWLRETAVAESLGVSRTPVREALRALAADGAVELVRHRGARVTAWTAEEIDEVYRLRALLEGYAARLAARDASPALAARLRRLADGFEEAVQRAAAGAPFDAAVDLNNEFHRTVLEASGSTRLAGLLGAVSSVPLVRRAFDHDTTDDLRRSVVQHRDIVNAVARGDEELAESAMRTHILAARYSAVHVADAEEPLAL